MKNLFKYNSESRFCLIGKINGLAVQSKRARGRILKGKTVASVSRLTFRKLKLGIDVRHHLLAYAFMRGAAYRSIEKTCRKDNMPRANHILRIVNLHMVPYYNVSQDYYTIDHIEAWLKGE